MFLNRGPPTFADVGMDKYGCLGAQAMESEEAFNTIDRLFQAWANCLSIPSIPHYIHLHSQTLPYIPSILPRKRMQRSEHCLWQKAHRICRFWEILQGEGPTSELSLRKFIMIFDSTLQHVKAVKNGTSLNSLNIRVI